MCWDDDVAYTPDINTFFKIGKKTLKNVAEQIDINEKLQLRMWKKNKAISWEHSEEFSCKTHVTEPDLCRRCTCGVCVD